MFLVGPVYALQVASSSVKYCMVCNNRRSRNGSVGIAASSGLHVKLAALLQPVELYLHSSKHDVTPCCADPAAPTGDVTSLQIRLADVEQCPLVLRPFIGRLYRPWMTDDGDCETVGGMND
jgi:hypothetical protein